MNIETLKAELADKIKTIDPIGKKLKFAMDDEAFIIDGSSETNTLVTSDDEADCTITMSLDTYLKLQRKEIKPLIATLKGLVKVKGNLSLAKKLKELM